MPAEVAARPSAEDRIRAALWFAERGFGVFSVWSTDPDGTCRCKLRGACDQPGKHPVPVTGFKAATTDPAKIRAMLSAGSDPNWGMLPPDGVFALDVDGEGIARLVELEALHGPLPATLRTNTAHGEHVFLRWPPALPRPIGHLFGYVTRWGSGASAGYVIGPRSVHASGAVYTPGDASFDIAELPEAWAAAAVAPSPKAEDVIVAGGYELPDYGYTGERYGAIRDFVASRYMRGIPREEILGSVLTTLAPRFAQPLTEAEIRSRFDRAWKGTPGRLGPPNEPEAIRRPRIEAVETDAADLIDMQLDPLKWIVPELLPEGTTIIAAEPKVGKSCLVYQIAVEASVGGDLLGRRVTPGSVLYLALEDGQRRGKDRLLAALAGRTMPRGRLGVRWSSNLVGQGLEQDIEKWLDAHPDAVMVAIDTLGKVRPRSTGKQGAYEVDVEALAGLQNLFRDRHTSLVIVHHARKATSDDFLASVSGTYGITGSADTIVVIRRKRLEKFGTVYVTGRDIADAEISVEFDQLTWRAAPGALSAASFERTEVYEVIRRRGPAFAKSIADEIGKERSNVQHLIDGLVAAGAVMRTDGGYAVAGVVLDPPYIPTNSIHSNSERGEHPYARESGWLRPCRHYADHQGSHRQTPEGWTCDACYPEGDNA
jgi:hypothetical protein